jgi:serine/threonine protein kinase
VPPAQVRMDTPVVQETGGHFDRYRLISPLGSGGVATIYRAYDLIDKTAIALKVLDARWLSDPEMVRKFLAEGEALHAIAQRDAAAAVVKCFRYGREHDSIVGRPFIALELLEGETLQSRLDREPRLDVLTAVAIGYQIASALVGVHGAGIVHRDLTPDNIFLKKGELTVGALRLAVPVVVLIDFGIARQELMSRMTLDGSIAGKPHFMAPEQCRGLPVDMRGDLYSLGIILYLMVAGRLPFAGRDPFEVMRAQMSDAPPPLGADVDPSYAGLCLRLLQKAPENRPAPAAAVAQELEQILFSVSPSSSMNVVTFPARRVSL